MDIYITFTAVMKVEDSEGDGGTSNGVHVYHITLSQGSASFSFHTVFT